MAKINRIVGVDFETVYDRKAKYSLGSKGMTTEKYIRDKRFKALGVGIRLGIDGKDMWVPGDKIDTVFSRIPWDSVAVLCHNAAFDCAILNWHYGIRPAYIFDTLSMARALFGGSMRVSLESLAKYYGLPDKGGFLSSMDGVYNPTPAQLKQLGDYCKHDVWLTFEIFKKTVKGYPVEELSLVDGTVRSYTEPCLELDAGILHSNLDRVLKRKQQILNTVAADKDELMSNDKFADVLRNFGVDPPRKISPRTGKETFAFAKKDAGMLELLEHPDEQVQTVVAARLGVKSTIEETRTEAFIGMAQRGPVPIMLLYYGAHTGRVSGGEKVNFQNLPRSHPDNPKQPHPLREALHAPDGYTLLVGDSAQIEARMTAFLAGQNDLIMLFRDGADVYQEFASFIYNKPQSDVTDMERFVGKTCIAEDELVLTHLGLVPIQNVTVEHLVWDGVDWVEHNGVLCKGLKEVITYDGLTATPDHLVYTGTTGASCCTLEAAQKEGYRLCTTGHGREAIRTANRRVGGGSGVYEGHGSEANVLGQPLKKATLGAYKQTGGGRKSGAEGGPTTFASEVPVYPRTLQGIWYRLSFWFARAVRKVRAKAFAARHLYENAYPTGERGRPLRTGEHSVNGHNRASKHGLRAMERGTRTVRPMDGDKPVFDRGDEVPDPPRVYRRRHNPAKRELKPVFDIINAGPRHRFTVSGKLVHNCILGLGYGMSAETLLKTFIGYGVDNIPLGECSMAVNLYRKRYIFIRNLWRYSKEALIAMINGQDYEIGSNNLRLLCSNNAIQLPNGMKLRYPELSIDGKRRFSYLGRLHGKPAQRVLLHGGKVTENIVQALSRIVVMWQMRYFIHLCGEHGIYVRIPLTVHDELVAMIPIDREHEARQLMVHAMSSVPKWAERLPVACEVGVHTSYGWAKKNGLTAKKWEKYDHEHGITQLL